MNRILKIIGGIIAVLVGIIILVVVAAYVITEAKFNQTFTVPNDQIALPSDATAIARGDHIVNAISHCKDCHGTNFAGAPIIDDPMLGRIDAPNITRGKNGLGSELTDADFVKILRYGVKPDNKSVLVMPSEEFTHLNDTDLGAVIAYVRSQPPVDSEPQVKDLKPLGRVLAAFGLINLVTATKINPEAHLANPPMGVTPDYGKYLMGAAGCFSCHGPTLSGGELPDAPPGLFPPAANITPGGEPGQWSEEDFIRTIRTGTNPGGHQLRDPMPWKTFKNMTDDELKAIWAYLKIVPAKPYGNH